MSATAALIGAICFHFLYPCVEVPSEEIPDKIVTMLLRPASAACSARAA